MKPVIVPIPNLNKDEELELGQRIQAKFKAEQRIAAGEDGPGLRAQVRRGNRAAEKLVRANARLVHSIAHKFKNRMPNSPDHADLFAAGMQGLWVAATKYDPSRGNKFSTVATHWIRQAIARSVNNTHRLVRLPENKIEDYSRIIAFLEEEGVNPSELDPEEHKGLHARIADGTGIEEETVRKIMNAGEQHVSLNRKVTSDDDSKELLDIISEVDNADSAENVMIREAFSKVISEATDMLSEVEVAVLSATNKIPLASIHTVITQKATREKYGLTHTDYKKAQDSALEKLRDAITARGIQREDFF